MMEKMEVIMGTLFKDKNGNVSSKRIFGAVLIVSGVVGYFLKLEMAITMEVLGLGAALLGLGVIEKKEAV